MLRLLAIPAALIGLLAVALAWSNRSAGADRADFAFINRGDNKCLDPQGMAWMQDIRLAYALWEGLYALDPQTLKPVPGSAGAVEVSPDQCVYTFHLRPEAKWSNGEPLLARDFVFEWRRMLETPGNYTYLHHYIRGAEAYEDAYGKYVEARDKGDRSAAAPDFATVGEQVLDDRTLRVTLVHPVPFFPSLCAFPAFFPMNEASMRDFAQVDPASGQTTYDQAFTRPPHLVTNGPFMMSQWLFKRRVRMTASPNYWDRANVRSRTIDQVYDDEPLAAYRMYSQGDVDWIADVDPDIAAELLKQMRPDVHTFVAFGTYYYEFNCQPRLPDGRPNPLADARVRRALAMAVEKGPIARDIGRLGQPPATTFIPPGVFAGYASPPGLAYDVPAARRLLADAGYPDGRGFPALSILFNNENVHGDVATVVRRQWLDHLNVRVDLEGVEIRVFGARLHDQQYAIARSSWYGDYDDPSTFTDKYLSTADGNDAKWASPAYDRLCAAAATEIDPAKRLALLSQAENLLLNDAPILPIYTYVGAYLFPARVTGIPLNPQQMVMFKAVSSGR